MSFYTKKTPKKEITLTQKEWEELRDQFIELTNRMSEACEDQESKKLVWRLGTIIFEIGNKGNWR